MLPARYFIALVAVILLVAGTEQSDVSGGIIGSWGNWKLVEDISAPRIIDIAKFAVSEYDHMNKKALVLKNVTKGAYREVIPKGTQYQGTQQYRLTLTVTDRENNSTLSYNPPVYEANVIHRMRPSPYNKLVYFDQISN